MISISHNLFKLPVLLDIFDYGPIDDFDAQPGNFVEYATYELFACTNL